MRHVPRYRGLLLVGLLPVLIATACGGSSSPGSGETSKSPDELLKAASSSLASAKSVKVSGEAAGPSGKIPIEVTLAPGVGMTGKVTYKGHPIEIVEVDKALYIKGGGALFGSLGGGAAAAALADKWLKLPLESSLTSAFGSVTKFEQSVKEPLAKLKTGTLKSTGTKSIEGVEATGVQSSEDPSTTVYVANESPNYPVAVETAKQGKFVFSDWNKEVSVTAPSGAVELSSLIPGA
ncbi:MAG TPA: hypothetical protein VMA83_10035 [Solirubrobacteraceae bacterium]|nr:hypothetical protein [Solirubrobacteraceae bacterium]